MLLPIIVTRGRYAGEYFSFLLKGMTFLSIEVQNVIKTFSTLIIILHVTGCLWHLAPYYNLSDNNNWITENGLDNSSLFSKYMASLYWATVTCTTVGYGDILPVNYFELVLCLFIIVFGVAVFSYILSNLSSQFSEITRSNAMNQERIQQIDQLDQKFKIGANLVDKLTSYFNNYNAELELETNQEMSYLLKILPSTLKTQLAKFLYQDAILVNRFLQDRDDNFYSKYLEELKQERFVKGDVISKIGNRVENIYFIMNGVVLNKTTNRYLEAGQMINYEYILQKTFITQNTVAETDVSALKYDRETFQNILD